MIHRTKSRFAAFVLFFYPFLLVAAPALIPLPQQTQLRSGMFTLCPPQTIPGAPTPAPIKILVDPNSEPTGKYLAALLFKSTGYEFPIEITGVTTATKGAILLSTANNNPTLGNEGYELTVDPASVLISAQTDAGVFYGVQTLLQLFPPEILSQRPVQNVPWTAPCVYIQDWPRFVWRGWMLDSVRHFFNKDEVKQLLDAMAIHKLNMFHWHLDDDAGWRVEIQKWPLLTQVSAWRSNTNSAGEPLWGLNPRSSTAWRGDGLYGGYYTQPDVREIVNYASQRHITIVPEIEMPGHSTSAMLAYPQFGCACPTCFTNYSLSVTSYLGGVFCIARPESMSFLQDVLTEVMDLFPGPYIHIGGDEVNFSNWNRHSLDQQMTNALGISSMQVYQGHFTQQIANYIKSKGRTMIGWSEIMNGGTITNTALMDWLNTKAVQAATNSEYVVMAPSSTLYINKWETATNNSGVGVIWSNEPPAQSGICTLPNVYAYEPIPASLPAAYTNFILGCEGPNWSEFIPSLKNMQFRMFPRLSAIAEVNWTSPDLKNYTDFTNRLETHQQRLKQMGINFNPRTVPPQIAAWSPADISTSYTQLTWDITSNVTAAGEVDVSFCWKTGANGLDIAWVALLENGVEIDRDTHPGFTGPSPSRPAYVLRLPSLRRGATYSLRAFVAGRGGTNSNGVIYRPNWN